MNINDMVKEVTESAIEQANADFRFDRTRKNFSTTLGTVTVQVMKKSGAMKSGGIGRGCFAVNFELNGKRIARAKLEKSLEEAAH